MWQRALVVCWVWFGSSSLWAQDLPSTVRDVPYVTNGSLEQKLDFYWAPGARTTVLFVHGGSLLASGERRGSAPYRSVCPALVEAGMACATMDYRLAPTHKWPAMPQDVASAVRNVRDLVSARGGDPERLILFGHSSGCQLAAVVGLDATYLQDVGLSSQNLAGVITMGCVLDRWDAAFRGVTAEQIRARFAADRSENERYRSAEELLAANPSFHLGRHAPPFLVLVAEDERFMPPILEQGARFVRRLLELKIPAEIKVVPGTHMSSISEIGDPGSAVLREVLAFARDPRRRTVQ